MTKTNSSRTFRLRTEADQFGRYSEIMFCLSAKEDGVVVVDTGTCISRHQLGMARKLWKKYIADGYFATK